MDAPGKRRFRDNSDVRLAVAQFKKSWIWPAMVRACSSEARHILKYHWKKVRVVANALMKNERLTGSQIRKLLAAL